MGCSNSSLRSRPAHTADGPEAKSETKAKGKSETKAKGKAEPKEKGKGKVLFRWGGSSRRAKPTRSDEAAKEYTRLTTEKSKAERRNVKKPASAEGKAPRERIGFTSSHRNLLGRCWELSDSVEVGVTFVHSVVPSFSEVMTNAVSELLALSHTEREFGSPTGTNSLRDFNQAVPLTSYDACTYLKLPHQSHHNTLLHHEQRQQQKQQKTLLARKATVKQSQWVSLVNIKSRSWTQRQNASVSESGRTAAPFASASHSNGRIYNSHRTNGESSPDMQNLHESFTRCDRTNTVSEPPTLLQPGKQRCASTNASECPFAGAKDIFAFRLLDENAESNEASFLKRRGLFSTVGVQIGRWDRVEVLYPNFSFSVATSAPAPQTTTVSSPVGSAMNAPSEARCSDNLSSTANSHPLYESFACGSLRRGSMSGEEDQRFPKESVSCQHFALASYLAQDPGVFQEMTSSPTTSCFTSNVDVTHTVEKRVRNAEDESHANLHVNLQTQLAGEDLGDPLTAEAPYKWSHSTATLTDPRHPSLHSSSPRSARHSNYIISVVASCFEASIDPFQWKKKRFVRAPIDYNAAKPAVRHRVGDGVVTRVMYGGVCVMECSSSLAVKEFEKILCSIRPHETKSMKDIYKEISRIVCKGNRTSSEAAPMYPDESVYPSECSSPKYSVVATEHLYCRIIQRVGGVAFNYEGLKTPKGPSSPCVSSFFSQHVKGMAAEKDPVTDGDAACECGPWMNVEAMAALTYLWFKQIESHGEFAEPIAVFVQRFTGILPSLLLASNEFGCVRHFENESDSGSSPSDNEGSLSNRVATNFTYVNNLAGSTNFFFCPSGGWEVDTEGDHVWRSRLNSALLSSARSIPLPLVLHTGRALTIVQEEEHTSPPTRRSTLKSIANSPLESCMICPAALSIRSSVASEEHHSRTLSSEISVERGPLVSGSQIRTARRTLPSVIFTENPSELEHINLEPAEAVNNQLKNGLCPVLSSKSSTAYCESETQWKKAVLELKALDVELRELDETLRDAEEKLLFHSNLANRMQSIFLPNAIMGNFMPICEYLEGALDSPGDLPGQCVHLDTPDWLSCAAVILSNPHHTVRMVRVAHAITMQSLPQIGMLAGLLFCVRNTSPLEGIALRCDKICSHASFSPFRSRKEEPRHLKEHGLLTGAVSWVLNMMPIKKQKKFSRTVSGDDKSSIAGGYSLWYSTLSQSPVVFLTPKQLSGVLCTLTRAVAMNMKCMNFLLHLCGFPMGDSTRPKNASGFFAAHRRRKASSRAREAAAGGAPSTKQKRNEEGKKEQENTADENETKDEEMDELPCWANDPAETLSQERRCALTAWREAERRAHCMVPRQRLAARPSLDPAARPFPDFSARTSPDPAARPSLDPAARPSPDPAARPSLDPAARPSPDPAARTSPDPTARPSPDPAARPSPEEPAAEAWGYGLERYEDERCVVNAAEELLLQASEKIFREVLRVAERIGSGGSAKEEQMLFGSGEAVGKHIAVRR